MGSSPAPVMSSAGLPVTGAGVLFALACQARIAPRALAYWACVLAIAMVSPTQVLSGEVLLAKVLKRAPSSKWPAQI